MSQQETIIGKLKLLPKLEGETLEDQCKRVYNSRYRTLDKPMEYHDSWQEQLSYDECYKKFVFRNDNLYEVIKRIDYDGCDVFNISDNKDGTYDFALSYYNGGCCFSEAIEKVSKVLSNTWSGYNPLHYLSDDEEEYE